MRKLERNQKAVHYDKEEMEAMEIGRAFRAISKTSFGEKHCQAALHPDKLPDELQQTAKAARDIMRI